MLCSFPSPNSETHLDIQLEREERLNNIRRVITLSLQTRTHLATENVTNWSPSEIRRPSHGALVPVVHDHLPIVSFIIYRFPVSRLYAILHWFFQHLG